MSNGKNPPAYPKVSEKVLAFLRDDPELQEIILGESGIKGTEFWLSKFITHTPSMMTMKDHVRKLAPLTDPVLIQGDSGTGKELIAHALHGQRKGKFIPVNCAGLPEHLIESELFGHSKGSFTGADKEKVGMLLEAKDGTLFLDEIGDLTLQLQAKLLRTIQESKIRPVGTNIEIDINCRFICATHHKLFEQMRKDLFRDDLYWRISTFTLDIKPLSIRTGDIIPIMQSLDPEGKLNLNEISYIADRPAEYLSGNVRSLQQIVRRYQILGVKP